MDRKNIETKSYYKLEDNIDEDKDNSKISFKQTLKKLKIKFIIHSLNIKISMLKVVYMFLVEQTQQLYQH